MVNRSVQLALYCIVSLAMPLERAAAAPPPPPPPYVTDVARILMSEEGTAAIRQLSGYVAEDVREYLNDKLVADGKASWVQHWTKTRVSGHVLAYSPDWRDNGSLMIVDQYDTVERWSLSPNSIADPRMISRATLFQFGPDRKSHVIRTILGGGFWIKP